MNFLKGGVVLKKDRLEEFKRTLRKRPCGIKTAKETTLSSSSWNKKAWDYKKVQKGGRHGY
jgi:hypothetical protein